MGYSVRQREIVQVTGLIAKGNGEEVLERQFVSNEVRVFACCARHLLFFFLFCILFF